MHEHRAIDAIMILVILQRSVESFLLSSMFAHCRNNMINISKIGSIHNKVTGFEGAIPGHTHGYHSHFQSTSP